MHNEAMPQKLKAPESEPKDWIPILAARRRSDCRPWIKRSTIWILPSTLLFHSLSFLMNRQLIWEIQYAYRKNNLRSDMIARKRAYNNNSGVRDRRLEFQRAPENQERRRSQTLACYHRNPAKWKARNKEWVSKNKDRSRKWMANWMRHKRRTDPQYLLGNRLRSRLWHALNGAKKSASTEELTGCTLTQLRSHLEAQFTPGMTWQNIHIDHITPCAAYDLTDAEQQHQCFHWSNLQPLFGADNISKGAKIAV